ncbi:tripartite tricarboxylate transporter substrate binding protein [Ramlibacter sp. WS9]|uniref:Bug family tripartite tricarboxylate transporter substrate binding protein n=1 Tax=Ramlibacter sp. WS9 TaxID=1882741 RepID=UPI0011423C1C|nr:tripartite tricarboxylate transporter substrate binding protein [Ramlibacter sp. WS9]ROZ69022.1 tripartite tricarboxylate transporter substrate binding protein [Ramlibacter sp. WS9]
MTLDFQPMRSAVVAVLLAAAAFIAPSAFAQADGTIRVVVPTNAGGPLDVTARMLATVLARNMNQTVIVENRPGASGIIGTEHVVKAPPDGRTMLLATGFVASNPVFYKVNYDPLRDLVPVIEMGQMGMLMLVRKDLDARKPADLQRIADLQKGGLNCGAPPGDFMLGCEQLKQLLGGAVVTVPYPGVAPAMAALAGGQVDLVIAPHDAAQPLVESGRVTAIATMGTKPGMPPFDRLPLASETWPGFTVIGFMGMLVPAGTPQATVTTLHRELMAAMNEPQVREFMRARGTPVEEGGPEKLGRVVAERGAHYRRLAATLGLKQQ